MNLFEIVRILFEAPRTAWNAVASMWEWISPELVCSATVNLAVLSAALLGAIWLVAPFDLKRRASHRNRAEHF
ncbi:hypothetical protein DND132_1235 [Pseudodesulfovibrio mercurii]|uniref:Uncharacterized protein n=1 Tax=Pseudodesulfovibrio mercurii TaxID=641491 RepID=F0JCE9_9BACT|nr:hypothetical protein [Pseudodesulfovibrio mercurii]EGB14447.1 hypothetical protein DND132_1235 [Pseudodesulfovibrio mercurii]